MKKTLFHIIFVFIIFCLSTNYVYAEVPEFSCMYNKPIGSDKVMLVQHKDGTIKVYTNKKNAGWDDENWLISSHQIIYEDGIKDGGYLKTCPKAKDTENIGSKINFYETINSCKNDAVVGILQSFECQDLSETKDYATVPKVQTSETIENDKTTQQSCSAISDNDKWISDSTGATLSCLYTRDITEGCHIVQMDFNETEIKVTDSFPGTNATNSAPKLDENLTSTEIINTYGGECPLNVYVKIYQPTTTSVNTARNIYFSEKTNSTEYNLDAAKGSNLATGEELKTNIEINFERLTITSCEDLFGGSDELISVISFLIKLVKIAIPILLIIMGSIDFLVATFSGNEEAMRKNLNKFIKRIIIAIIIFLVPSILKMILMIANGIWGNIDADLCGIL